MELAPTTKKRIIIALTFFAIFVITVLGIYFITKPEATCTDGIKNQKEKGVDCGGTCTPCDQIFKIQDIVINETAVVFGGNDSYDAVVKISNPNDAIGASFFRYVFNLKDVDGKIIATSEGTSFILPADFKYIADLGIKTEGNVSPSMIEFLIMDAKWEKLDDIGKPRIGIYSKNFGKVSSGIGSVADAIIRNESRYNLNKISIVVILRSSENKIVAVNKTEKNTVRIREERDFRLNWPYEFPVEVQSIEVDAQVNVFDSQSFSF
ncbi:MAG: hypothetical protein ACD_8C00126G0002 [uncultured bacterium]|nr:MAG: hypothetical protein ACD_8C00126G0002 [uncultured bacterium]